MHEELLKQDLIEIHEEPVVNNYHADLLPVSECTNRIFVQTMYCGLYNMHNVFKCQLQLSASNSSKRIMRLTGNKCMYK